MQDPHNNPVWFEGKLEEMTESGKGLVGWYRKARQVRIRGSPENARRLEEALEEARFWQREVVTRESTHITYMQ